MRLRKELEREVKGIRGRPKTEYSLFELLDSIEVDLFLMEIFEAIREVENKGDKITKTSVAEKLFPYNSNSMQAFSRKLKQFQFTFEHIIENKPLYTERLEAMIKETRKNNNNKSP